MTTIDNITDQDLENMTVHALLDLGKSMDRNGLWDEQSIIDELGVEAMEKSSIIESVKRVLES
jgi:hypothetical protein